MRGQMYTCASMLALQDVCLNQPFFAGFSICAENPSESSQRDLVARPRTSPWGARFSGLLKSRPRIDTPGRQPGNPGGSPIAKGCSLKWSSDSLQWHSPSIKQRRSLSISRRFSLKRVTWFEQPSFYWARSLKRLWNLPLRRINIMLLKFVTLEHGKTPTMENLRKQLRFQWKKINGRESMEPLSIELRPME